jgi:hypothetical protein
MFDGFVKSPSVPLETGLRFNFVATIDFSTLYEIIMFERNRAEAWP